MASLALVTSLATDNRQLNNGYHHQQPASDDPRQPALCQEVDRQADLRRGESRDTPQKDSRPVVTDSPGDWSCDRLGNLHGRRYCDWRAAVHQLVDCERATARLSNPPQSNFWTAGGGSSPRRLIDSGGDSLRVYCALLRRARLDDSHRGQRVHLHLRNNG